MHGNLYVYFVINIREGHEPSAFEDEMAIRKLKTHISPVIYQIQAEFIIASGREILSEITKLINSISNREETLGKWKEWIIYPSLRKAIKQIIVIIEAYHFGQLRTNIYPSSFSQS